MESQYSFLWLFGIPGCGKTVLSTSIIEHLSKLDDGQERIVIYFYFDFNDAAKQTVDSMARSLIAQCSYQSRGDARRQIEQLFRSHECGKKQPTTEALLALFMAISQGSGRVRIVLDALDECIARKELLQWMRELVAPRTNNIQLIVTSRKEPELVSEIAKWASPDEKIGIQQAQVDEDIRAYVKARVADPASELKRWHSRPDVQNEIAAKLMEKAKGM